MIYGIIVFGLRKGFQMFPEMFGYENTIFGLRGKAHEALGRCKRKFCGGQRLDARVPGVWGGTTARKRYYRLYAVLESE